MKSGVGYLAGLVLFIAAGLFSAYGISDCYDNGANPIPLCTCEDVNLTRNGLSSSYRLQNNIDCSNTSVEGEPLYYDGLGWLPIGNSSNKFTGIFDGNGYNISNLFINRTTQIYIGLFGFTNGANITNLGLLNVDVRGGERIGSVLGYTTNSKDLINNTFTTGNVTGNESGSEYIGGIAGIMYGKIAYSYFYGNVSSGAGSKGDIGGITGYLDTNGQIIAAYTEGLVTSSGGNVGGIVGRAYGSISNSYSHMNITLTGSQTDAGGFIGATTSSGSVTASYSTGNITGGNQYYTHNFIGVNQGSCTNSFWDINTSTYISSSDFGCGTSKRTGQMQTLATFTDTATSGLSTAWDFSNNPNNDAANNDYWHIDGTTNSGYPFLLGVGVGKGIDGYAPTISISTPANSAITNDTGLNVNYTATDNFLDSCWYSNDSMAENISLSPCETNITGITWSEGQHNVTVYANDTSGNIGSAAVSFTIDLTSPTFTGIENRTTDEEKAFSFKLNATDIGQVDCFRVNDTSNFAINCSGSLTNNTVLAEGLYNLNITVNDTIGYETSAEMWVNVTLVGRIAISLLSPSENVNVSYHGTAIVSANVSCQRADCGVINVTLQHSNRTDILNEQFEDTSVWSTTTSNSNCNSKGSFQACDSNSNDYQFYISAYPYSGSYALQFDDWDTFDYTKGLWQNITPLTDCNGFTCDDYMISFWEHNYNLGSGDYCIVWLRYSNGTSVDLWKCSDGDACDDGTTDSTPEANDYVFRVVNLTDESINLNDSELEIHVGARVDGSTDYCFFDEFVISAIKNGFSFNTSLNQTANLSLNESATVSWEINATGSINATQAVFVVANRTEDTTISNMTGQANITIVGATPGPTLAVEYPASGSYTPNAGVHINYSVSSATLDACWYTNDSYYENITLGGCANITSATWSDGQHTIIVYANDSSGESSATVIFTVDTINPGIAIDLPENDSSTPFTGLNVNYTAADTNLEACWYSNDSYAINTTLAGCTNITSAAWNEGQHNVTVWANDSAGNENSSTVTFTIETANPELSISSPANNSNHSDSSLDVLYKAIDVNLASCWYSNDSYMSNTTLPGCANITSVTWSTGQHNVTVWANDSAGNWNSSTVSFTMEFTKPEISVIYPPNTTNTTDTGLHVNYSAYDEHLEACWYSNDSYYENITLGGCANITSVTWSTGRHNVTVWANDSYGNVNSSTVTFTIDPGTGPEISLISPANGGGDGHGNITFLYTASDISGIANCSLYVNRSLNTTNETVADGALQSFTVYSVPVGRHNWSINCTDTIGNTGWNGTWSFDVIRAFEFSGDTTDLNGMNLSNVSGLVLHKGDYGRINFTASVDLSNVSDISSYVNISFNRIEINSSALPQLNKSAQLALFNITFSNPRLLKDDEVCPETVCEHVSYSGGTILFNVTEFSIYSSEETPQAAAEQESSSTGSSGGGGGSRVLTAKEDREYSVYLRKYADYPIIIKGERHRLTIIETGDRTARLRFASDEHTIILILEEKIYLDFDGDSIYDIYIVLEEVLAEGAKVRFAYVQEPVNRQEDNTAAQGKKDDMPDSTKTAAVESPGAIDGDKQTAVQKGAGIPGAVLWTLTAAVLVASLTLAGHALLQRIQPKAKYRGAKSMDYHALKSHLVKVYEIYLTDPDNDEMRKHAREIYMQYMHADPLLDERLGFAVHLLADIGWDTQPALKPSAETANGLLKRLREQTLSA